MNQKDLTTVIINYQTPQITTKAIKTFRSFYPEVQILVIDNGSKDDSLYYLNSLRTESPNHLKIIVNKNNIYHGPAMDLALRELTTPFVHFLDSDCEVYCGGFLEKMVNLLQADKENYAVGKLVFVNKRGFEVPSQGKAIPYIRPSCMVIKRYLYLALPPFTHHGSPCLLNMKSAYERGLKAIDFPINDFIYHYGRGTASKYGYGLGISSKIDYLLNKIGM